MINSDTIFPENNDSENDSIDAKAVSGGIIPVVDVPSYRASTILIVDDVPNNLVLLTAYLEKQYKILVAANAESAIRIAKKAHPDLILLDALMPGVDGFEACRRLKQSASTEDIPVIFVSAIGELERKVEGFEAGGVDYIIKPVQEDDVLIRVRTHLNLHKMQEALTEKNREQRRVLKFEGLVRRVSDTLRDSLDERYILTSVTRELAEVLNLGSCQIEFYDSDKQIVTIEYEHCRSLPSCLGDSRKLLSFPEFYQQLLETTTIKSSGRTPHFDDEQDRVAQLACPIFDDQGVIGNLWGLRSSDNKFSQREVRLVQQIANQCAIAIRQARLYEAANKQVKELARLNKLKDDFLKSISHELKTPVSSIKLAAQTMQTLLESKKNLRDSRTFRRVINIFQESCRRQEDLINDLLTLCYLDAKAQALNPEPIDLNIWLLDLVQPYFKRMNAQGQRTLVDLAEKNISISADPKILERIVRELLQNAMKYTPVNETITIHTESIEPQASFCVINTGVEISEDEQEMIFEQFYRVPNNDPWKYGGTGLGLAIVQKLVVLLDAEIDISSRDLQTIFCIRFKSDDD